MHRALLLGAGLGLFHEDWRLLCRAVHPTLISSCGGACRTKLLGACPLAYTAASSGQRCWFYYYWATCMHDAVRRPSLSSPAHGVSMHSVLLLGGWLPDGTVVLCDCGIHKHCVYSARGSIYIQGYAIVLCCKQRAVCSFSGAHRGLCVLVHAAAGARELAVAAVAVAMGSKHMPCLALHHHCMCLCVYVQRVCRWCCCCF